jgi:hypothetical protein
MARLGAGSAAESALPNGSATLRVRGTALVHPPSKPEVCCPDLWFLGEDAHQTSVVREYSLPWMVAPLSELVTGF